MIIYATTHIIIMWNVGVSILSYWSFGYSLFERNFEWKLQISIKNTRNEEPFSNESLKEPANKVWFEVYFAASAKTSIKIRCDRDWENFNIAIDEKGWKLLLTAFLCN